MTGEEGKLQKRSCVSVSLEFWVEYFNILGKTLDQCRPMLSRERLSGILRVQVYPEHCLLSVGVVRQCSATV